MFLAFFLLAILCLQVECRRQCLELAPFLRYYKMRACYKSKLPMISWKNADNVTDCIKFSRDKKGLAFNFSPISFAGSQSKQFYKTCQVLGCPEPANSSTLVPDHLFDYYSAYGNYNSSETVTCLKSVGLFNVIEEKRNYSAAIEYCQSLGADLADILSETRTNGLANLIRRFKGWYKAAYVGLDDMKSEGVFETPLGNYLECTKFRAWLPGHPRKNRSREDCVILDADRVWRAINCKIKLGFICEVYPNPPDSVEDDFQVEDCSKINNKQKKEKCLDNMELYELFKNSSRIDQCALINAN